MAKAGERPSINWGAVGQAIARPIIEHAKEKMAARLPSGVKRLLGLDANTQS